MRAWWIAPAHIAGYLAATASWIGCLSLVVGVGVVLAGGGVTNVEAFMADNAELLSWVTLFQFAGMTLVAGAMSLLLPLERRGGARVAEALALRRPSGPELAVGLLLGAVVGTFPGWVIEQLGSLGGSPLVNGYVESALSGSWSGALAMVATIGVAAPLCEELVFRGYLWTAVERSAPPWAAFVVTSLLFTAFHLDPSQMLGVLPIAFALGFVRWSTGSVWPGVALHAANNGLALALMKAMGDEPAPTPLWVALVALLLTAAGFAGLVALRRR